ncbi:MAG: sigma-70 family RNA polymerase sigma factor [Pyramidobacter sp.]|jgi:RNA polymerase sigma factor (sigma-70 family)
MQQDTIATTSMKGALALRYMPLARKIAWRYTGRGAEYEDLLQEAFIELYRLIGRYQSNRPPQTLSLYLWYRLPAKVRDRAEKLRRSSDHDSLEQKYEEAGFDVPFSDANYALFELLECLSPDEQKLARALASGWTQAEVGQALRISQQAVSRRVAGLRKKIRSALGYPVK